MSRNSRASLAKGSITSGLGGSRGGTLKLADHKSADRGVHKSIERWSERSKTWKDAEERLVFACESLEEREKWVFYLGMILEYFVTTL